MINFVYLFRSDGGLGWVIPRVALWVSVVKSNLRKIDYGAECTSGSNRNGSFEDILEVRRNIIAARLTSSQAESATLLKATRAVTPANRSLAVGSILTWRVAKPSIIVFTRVAGERSASGATVRIFLTRDANVLHTLRAVR